MFADSFHDTLALLRVISLAVKLLGESQTVAAEQSVVKLKSVGLVIEPNEEIEGQDPGSPIGDAALPLLLFAMTYTAYVVVRKRRKLVVEEVARS